MNPDKKMHIGSGENNFTESVAPNSFEIMNELKPHEARIQKPRGTRFLLARNFEHMTLLARRRRHFRGFAAIFWVAPLPPKEVCLYTNKIT